MELILKKDVENLGFTNDLVIVKNGYGRNFLLPQGLAVLATPSTKKILAETLKQRAFKEKKIVDDAQKEADKLNGLEIKIASKTGEGNKLFGSVSSANLVEAFESNGVTIRRGKAGRHRQQGMVERMNQTIGIAIFTKQYEKELKTGKTSRLWLHLYKPIINNINLRSKKMKIRNESPTCEGNTCEVLAQGTQVLAVLDEPHSIEGTKIIGKFRSADLKYSPKIRIIKQLIIKPNSPPLYLLDGSHGKNKVDRTAYTKNQLLVLNEDEIKKLKNIQ